MEKTEKKELTKEKNKGNWTGKEMHEVKEKGGERTDWRRKGENTRDRGRAYNIKPLGLVVKEGVTNPWTLQNRELIKELNIF